MHTSVNNFLTLINNLILKSAWPLSIRIAFLLAGLTVLLGCVVDFYVPIYAEKIVDSLTETVNNQSQDFCWRLVVIFAVLKIFQGVGALSLITCIQRIMWISIEHHVRYIIQVNFFRHVHSMSFTWLMKAKMGDLLAALEMGTDSIISTLEHLLYSIIPTFANILIALSYLSIQFGWLYATIVGLQIAFYTAFTAYIIEKRSLSQSSVNEAEGILRQKGMDSVINVETVKSYGNERFEKRRYFKSLRVVQQRQFKIGVLTSLSESFQHAIVCTGLLLCSLLLLSSKSCGKNKSLTTGDYVLLTAYLSQLNGPLNYLAGYYKKIRINIVNAESMMKYLRQEPEVKNLPLARHLCLNHASIEFQNVSLTNEQVEILKDISFTVAPKTTLALVGCTGSGKTSIVRLLLRLVDPTSGNILIDGENVKSITMESLRKAIGIIPQDTSLFNDTIRNNIRYGKPDATDHEVMLAASLAQIHKRILSFPQGYDTVVCNRGARLSGGERQRIAISRAILMDPQIIVLDEATSALDGKTEKLIQEMLTHLCRNRTCIMITHNLALTENADSIIVLKNGRIVEKGSYDNLMKKNGHFAELCKDQRKNRSKSKMN